VEDISTSDGGGEKGRETTRERRKTKAYDRHVIYNMYDMYAMIHGCAHGDNICMHVCVYEIYV